MNACVLCSLMSVFYVAMNGSIVYGIFKSRKADK